MTVYEVLEKRWKLYNDDLKKTWLTADQRQETEARIKELENLIFIINTQPIKGIK